MIKLLNILQEVIQEKKMKYMITPEKDIEYWRKLWQIQPNSPTGKFNRGVLATVFSKQKGYATDRQEEVLRRIETGDTSPYSPKNENKDIHQPSKPGILKKRLGTLSCSKVSSERSKLKDKGTHYAKALQRYLNYHC
jgi:hypothetical protein